MSSQNFNRQKPDAPRSSQPGPRVVYEDDWVLVIEKPPGLLSQSDSSQTRSLTDWIRDRYPGSPPFLVHRLDRNTSGLMVIARNSKSAAFLTEQIQDGRLDRKYLSWCLGVGSPIQAQHWLLKNPHTNKVTVFRNKPESPLAKEASLSAEPLRTSTLQRVPITLFKVTLESGRSHQIRAQLSFLGHPILGDTKYKNKKHTEVPEFSRTALHSCSLSFFHPEHKTLVQFESDLPKDLALP